MRGGEAQGYGQTQAHDYDEDDVGRGGDGAGGLAVGVEAKVYGASYDCCSLAFTLSSDVLISPLHVRDEIGLVCTYYTC